MDDFYDKLGQDYDVMTQFETRLAREMPIFERLVGQFGFKRVLDAGCGSGVHAVLLSKLGLQVVAADVSPGMVAQAKANTHRHGERVELLASALTDLEHTASGEFDGILCLGNTLPHLLKEEDVWRTLCGFNSLLSQSGVVILQVLNYSKILRSSERMVGVTEGDGATFVRFYDFEKDSLQFNTLVIKREQGRPRHQWLSTNLYPWRRDQLDNLFRQTGFHNVSWYGDLSLNPFDEDKSSNLVVVASS